MFFTQCKIKFCQQSHPHQILGRDLNGKGATQGQTVMAHFFLIAPPCLWPLYI